MLDTIRKLHPRGAANRGICVDADGAMLGPDCVLVSRTSQGFRPIARGDAAMLQKSALPADADPDWLFQQCQRIADALNKGELTLAQIYGLRIPIDDLDDRQLRRSAAVDLAKTGFNPDEPRFPKGDPHGGEWTTSGGTGGAAVTPANSSAPARLLADLTGQAAAATGGPPESPIGSAPTTLDSPDLQLDVSVTADAPGDEESDSWTVHIPWIGDVPIGDLINLLMVLASRGRGKSSLKPPLRSSSRRLGRNIERELGTPRPTGFPAHHIVAKDAEAAKPAQAILERFGIDIDDAVNGVFLPKAQHQPLHENAYYDAVNKALATARTRSEAEQILRDIARKLQEGTFP
jgi:hypothetical protein